MTLTYDDAVHEYRWDGRVIPSVTQAISSVLYDPARYADGAATRGQYVHVLTRLDDEGRLPDGWRDRWGAYGGYVDAWRAFRRDSGLTVTAIEERVTGELANIRYAGTIDRVGMIDGRRCVLDLKTGAPEPWHAVQTAGYAYALAYPGPVERYAVYVHDTGTYTLTRHEGLSDVAVFAACLTVDRWIR